jgi:predicted MFS family arabinose efflux permease
MVGKDARLAEVGFGLGVSCLAAYQQFKLPPVLPLLIARYHYDRPMAGAFMSVFALAGLALSVALGRWMGRSGLGPSLALAFALMIAGNLMGLIAPEMDVTMLMARLVEGVGFAIFAIAGPVIATGHVGPRHVPFVLGLMATWIPIGQLAAAALAPLAIALDAWQILWVAALLLTLALAAWGWFLRRDRVLASGAGGGGRTAGIVPSARERRDLLAGAVVFMLWSAQYFAYMTWLPQYLIEARGLSANGAILGYALPIVVLLIFNVLSGIALRARVPLGPLMMGALAVQAAVWWLTPFTQSAAAGIVSLVFYGIAAGIVPTCLFAVPNAVLGPGRAGAHAYAVLMTGRNLGVLVGPVLLAWLSGRAGGWGLAVPIFGLATTLALLGAIPLMRARAREVQGTSR